MRDRELAGLARTLSRDSSLQVSFGGDQSFCDMGANRINIARMPYSEKGRQLMCALVTHEVGHKNYTTGEKPDGFLGALTNVIEDIRIEALTLKQRPGSRFDLDALTTYYAAQNTRTPKTPAQAVLAYVMALGRGTCLHQMALRDLEQLSRDLLLEQFGADRVKDLDDYLLEQLPRLLSTKASEDCARQCLPLLSPESDKHQEQSEDESDDQPHSAQTDSSSSRDQSEDSSEDEVARPSNDLSPEAYDPEIGNFADIAQFATQELDRIAQSHVEMHARQIPSCPQIRIHRGESSLDEESHCLAFSSRLRTQLPQLLQAQRLKKGGYRSRGKRLAPRKLAHIASGDVKFYRAKEQNKDVNTAVMLLLDNSGSMGLSQGGDVSLSQVATQAAFSLHHALFALAGIRVASVAFAMETITAAPLMQLCDFDEKPQGSQFALNPCGGTPVAQALWYARAALKQCVEPRKVVILLTDGEPNDAQETLAATQSCVAEGIEIYALGIFSDAVKTYWPRHAVIDSLAGFPEKLFEIFAASQLAPLKH